MLSQVLYDEICHTFSDVLIYFNDIETLGSHIMQMNGDVVFHLSILPVSLIVPFPVETDSDVAIRAGLTLEGQVWCEFHLG